MLQHGPTPGELFEYDADADDLRYGFREKADAASRRHHAQDGLHPLRFLGDSRAEPGGAAEFVQLSGSESVLVRRSPSSCQAIWKKRYLMALRRMG